MPNVKRPGRPSGEETRERLLRAAVDVLSTQGIRAATTRGIGEAAGLNPALIGYHYGGLDALLLAALDASTDARLARYAEGLDGVDSWRALRPVVRRLHQEDRASGHVRLLAEMVAAGLMDPRLGAEVAQRVEPWAALTERTLVRLLPAPLRRRVPVAEAAHGLAAMFLGLELLGILSGDHARGDAVVDRLTRLTQLRPGRT